MSVAFFCNALGNFLIGITGLTPAAWLMTEFATAFCAVSTVCAVDCGGESGASQSAQQRMVHDLRWRWKRPWQGEGSGGGGCRSGGVRAGQGCGVAGRGVDTGVSMCWRWCWLKGLRLLPDRGMELVVCAVAVVAAAAASLGGGGESGGTRDPPRRKLQSR